MVPKLGQISNILMGTAPNGSGPARYIQIRDLRGDREEPLHGAAPTAARATPIQEHDILFASRGDPAPVGIADPFFAGGFVTPDVYLIRPSQDLIDPAYLLSFLRQSTVQAALRRETAGSLLPRIPKPALEQLMIPLPPLDRQRAIGALAMEMERRTRLFEKRLKAEVTMHTHVMNQIFSEIAEDTPHARHDA